MAIRRLTCSADSRCPPVGSSGITQRSSEARQHNLLGVKVEKQGTLGSQVNTRESAKMVYIMSTIWYMFFKMAKDGYSATCKYLPLWSPDQRFEAQRCQRVRAVTTRSRRTRSCGIWGWFRRSLTFVSIQSTWASCSDSERWCLFRPKTSNGSDHTSQEKNWWSTVQDFTRLIPLINAKSNRSKNTAD